VGGSGLVGLGTLVVRAFLQALRATAEVGDEKNRTIARLEATVTRQDAELDRLQTQLLAAMREQAVRDITIDELKAQRRRTRGEGTT
jgi:uncharacterized coiled-coil protein SlyX